MLHANDWRVKAGMSRDVVVVDSQSEESELLACLIYLIYFTNLRYLDVPNSVTYLNRIKLKLRPYHNTGMNVAC